MPVMPRQDQSETFEKRSILFKVKEGENFNRPAWYTKRQRHHTLKFRFPGGSGKQGLTFSPERAYFGPESG